MSTLARLPKNIKKKRVNELTPEEKRLLREWLFQHRPRGAKLDIHYQAKNTPVYVKTWLRHPNKFDIPGVDTPETEKWRHGKPPAIKKTKPRKRKYPYQKETKVDTIKSLLEKIADELKKHIKKYGYIIKHAMIIDKPGEEGILLSYYDKQTKDEAIIGITINPDKKVSLLISSAPKTIKTYLAPLPLFFNSLEELYKELSRTNSKIAKLLSNLGILYTISALYTELRETGSASGLPLEKAIEKLKEYNIPIPDKAKEKLHQQPKTKSVDHRLLTKFYEAFKNKYGIYKETREFIEQLDKKYKNIEDKVIALIKKMADDYGFLMNSRLMKIAKYWIDKIMEEPKQVEEAVKDISGYLELQDFIQYISSIDTKLAKDLAEEEYKRRVKRELGLEYQNEKEVLKEYDPSLYDKLEKYFPEALDYVAAGLKKLTSMKTQELKELLYTILSEMYSPRDRKYMKEVIMNEVNYYLDEFSKAKTISDKLSVINNVFNNIGDYTNTIAFLYILGKYNKIDQEQVRKELKKYLNKIYDILHTTIEDKSSIDFYLKGFNRAIRSNQYFYKKQIPLYMYLDILFNSKTGSELLNLISKYSPKHLVSILMDLVSETTVRSGRWLSRERKDYVPTYINSVLETIILEHDKLYSIDKLISSNNDETVLNHLIKTLGFPRPDIGPIKIVATKNGNNLNVKVYLNGKTIFNQTYDLQGLVSLYTDIDRVFRDISIDIEKALRSHGINIDISSKERKPVFYRVTNNGIEIIYPEKKLYKWSDPNLIKRYHEYTFLVSTFKEEAKKHGIDYPEDISDAYEWIERVKSPKIELYRGNKYYVKIGSGWPVKTYSANTLKELFKIIEEEIYKGNIPVKYIPKLIDIMEKYGYQLKEQEIFKEAMKIGKAIDANLYKDEYGFMDAAKILLVTNKPFTALKDKEKYPANIENIYIIKNNTYIPLLKAKMKDIDGWSTISVKYNNGKENYYPAYLAQVIKRYGTPKEIYIYGKDGPIELIYNKGLRVYIAPRLP